MKRVSSGFTLIEILIVLAILGVLMGIFGLSYLRSLRAAEVREGANQIAADLRAARASSQRQSQNASLSWADGMVALTTYSVALPSVTTPQTRTLPRGVTFRCVTGGGCPTALGGVRTLTYSAPYGEMTTTINGTRFIVESQTPNIPSIEVRVVGVTGRIMLVRP